MYTLYDVKTRIPIFSTVNELESALTVTKLIKWKFFPRSSDDFERMDCILLRKTRYMVDGAAAAAARCSSCCTVVYNPKNIFWSLLNVKRNLCSPVLWKTKLTSVLLLYTVRHEGKEI